MAIDLTGGEVKVLGNCNDTHIFRLSNPEDQGIIADGGEYKAEFIPDQGGKSDIVLDISEVSIGVLSFTVTIKNGVYIIRRLNPRRTLLSIEVEAR